VTRLQLSTYLGLSFAALSLGVILLFQIGLMQYLQSPKVISITVPTNCAAAIRPSATFRSNGRFYISFWHDAKEGLAELEAPSIASCFSPGAITVAVDGAIISVEGHGNGEIGINKDLHEQVFRSVRTAIAVDIDFIERQMPALEEGVTLSFELSDWGFGLNPAEVELDVSWLPRQEVPDEKEIDVLEAESFTFHNNCAGCIIEVGSVVVPSGGSYTIALDVNDLSYYGMDSIERSEWELLFGAAWDYERRVKATLRFDDPSRAALESNVATFALIVFGASFSLLTEAFLLTGLARISHEGVAHRGG
jgi:hypothetical protein